MTLHIIVAGGTGTRFGSPLPKQYCPMGGSTVIAHTLEAIRAAAEADDIIRVAVSPGMTPTAVAAGIPAELIIEAGGATRAATVARALTMTDDIPADIISIHDAARPYADREMICRVIAAARPSGAIPVIELRDSIRAIAPDGTSRPADRSAFRAVQTPQAFPATLLRAAYATIDLTDPRLTDDATAVELTSGQSPALVAGSPANIKITTRADLPQS